MTMLPREDMQRIADALIDNTTFDEDTSNPDALCRYCMQHQRDHAADCVVRKARPFASHRVRGKPIGPEGIPYGQVHDTNCPPCSDTPWTASPRSETYWSS